MALQLFCAALLLNCQGSACLPAANVVGCLRACVPAGVDGIVKFWDLRQSGAPAGQAAPAMDLARLCDASVPHISQKQHGITSLALHPQGKGCQPACPHMGACLSSSTFPTIQKNLKTRVVSPPLLCAGSQLLVSLTGGHHFVYDPLRPHIGPIRWFGGHTGGE